MEDSDADSQSVYMQLCMQHIDENLSPLPSETRDFFQHNEISFVILIPMYVKFFSMLSYSIMLYFSYVCEILILLIVCML